MFLMNQWLEYTTSKILLEQFRFNSELKEFLYLSFWFRKVLNNEYFSVIFEIKF